MKQKNELGTKKSVQKFYVILIHLYGSEYWVIFSQMKKRPEENEI